MKIRDEGPAATFDNITTWNDANGAACMVTGVGGILRDSVNIYARASWRWWSGGRILSFRQMGHTEDVLISNYRAEDPLPSLTVFTITVRTIQAVVWWLWQLVRFLQQCAV